MANDLFRSDDEVITSSFMLSVAKFEGFRSKPYRCPSGVLTVGYGHTGADVHIDTRFTLAYAADVLYSDLLFALYSLEHTYDMTLWTIGLKQAMVDFVFNCGIGTLKKSSLHNMLLHYSNKNTSASLRGFLLSSISYKLLEFVYSNHVKLKGLVERRKFEVSLLELG